MAMARGGYGKRVGEDYIHPVPDYAGAVPPLPPVHKINPDAYVGPTEESNWVIYGRLLVGAYPSSVHDDANTRILTGVLRLGITTFVCLQQECVPLPAVPLRRLSGRTRAVRPASGEQECGRQMRGRADKADTCAAGHAAGPG